VPLLPPTISLTSATGGTATFTFTSDGGFPSAETTFWLLDPTSGAVLLSFGPFTPPTAALPGLDETATYVVIATSFDSGTSDVSAPSLPVTITPQTWAGPSGGLKNVIHTSPKAGARSYQLIDQGSQAVLVDHPYPVFVDTRVFASEELAQEATYEVKALGGENPGGCTIVRLYRTNKTLCLVTGEVLELNGEPPTVQPTPVEFRMHRLNVPDTNRPRRRREVQRAYQTDFQVEAWPNYLGQWGAYLMSGSVIWAEIGDRRIEFMVPFSTTAELVDITQTERSIIPKRT